jgi:hypothetical protein
VTLSFVDERQFLTVIQPIPAPAESVATESPPADPAPAKSSIESLHSAIGDALTETS